MRKSISRTLRVLLIIILLMILLSAYGWSRWQELKHTLGLTVDWNSLHVGFKGLTFKQLHITQQGSDGTVFIADSQELSLSFFSMTSKKLAIQITQTNNTEEEQSNTPINISEILNTVSWAPNLIDIKDFTLTLPCEKGSCIIAGQASLIQNKATDLPFSLQASLNNSNKPITINADLYRKKQLLILKLNALLANEPLITMSTQVDEKALTQWQGTFKLHKVKDTQSLFIWLNEWLPNQQLLSQMPESSEATASWELSFPKGLGVDFRPENGFIDIDASLPTPLPIIKFGYLKGVLTLHATISNYRPRIEKLATDLTLTHLALNNVPKELQADTVSLKLQPLPFTDLNIDRAIKFEFTTQGKLNTQLSGNILVNKQTPAIIINNGVLAANTDQLTVMGYRFKNSQLSFPFQATIAPNETTILFEKNSFFTSQQLTSTAFSAKNIKLVAEQLETRLNYEDKNNLLLSITSPIDLTTSSLKQSVLKTIGWHFKGALNATKQEAKLSGKLSNTKDLSTTITLLTDYTNKLTINAKTSELFFRTTNVLANTLADWPAVLEIVTGKTTIESSLTIPFNKNAFTNKNTIKFNGLSGVYDRSDFRDLSGSAIISISNNTLKITLPDLALTEANPGVDIGPLQFNGEYTSPLKNPLSGMLKWKKAETSLFSGTVWATPSQLNLAKLPQKIDLHIKGIELTNILKAYPTEGLNGKGTLDGTLPLLITKTGLDIEHGKLGAREPGYIKFDSPAIHAVGENNPSMKLVTDALEDFQYSILTSQVSYNDGKAVLGLHIKGKNPDIKNNQLFNLNINLEENIPALLTSLQLTDRVSETVRKRVQKRLQQSTSKKPTN